MEYSAKIIIKQKTLKDVLSFISNTTKEVTIHVSRHPINHISFYSQLDGVKLYLSIKNQFFSDFSMEYKRTLTDQPEGIWLNTYLNGILDVVNSFGKLEDLELIVRSDGIQIGSQSGDIKARIDGITSLPNHFFVVDEPTTITQTAAEITDITKFFKTVGLFINQERTLMDVDVTEKDMLIYGSSLECSFQHQFKRIDDNVVKLPKMCVSTLVVNRFRNIKNLSPTLIMGVLEINDKSHCLSFRSKDCLSINTDTLGLVIAIFIPLKTKLM